MDKTSLPDGIPGGVGFVRRGPERPLSGRPEADSRLVVPGGIFVAIPGTTADGHDFIDRAIDNGAEVIFHSRELAEYPENITFYQCSSCREVYAGLCNHWYGDPRSALALYGVTGTNGKTTTVYLLNRIFSLCGRKSGYLSTVEFCDGVKSSPATHTTPDTGTLYRILGCMRDNGVTEAAMELSSHSLHQQRAAGLKFKAAIFTNLTGDHLDYHGNMDEYYRCKKILFTDMTDADGTAVIDLDDPYGRRLAAELSCAGIKTAGFTMQDAAGAAYRICDHHTGSGGVSFTLAGNGITLKIKCNLCGMHNIYNLAGAVIAALAGGFPPEMLQQVLGDLELQVPGRLEKLTSPAGADFYIDYAHTHDALERALEALRPVTAGRLWVLFGAGGDRDRTKRPKMGRAAMAADHIILTSDNPRSEEPEHIISEVASGIAPERSFERISDRREALRYAAGCAAAGDVVLVAGKGHEDYQEIKGRRFHFSDRETLLELFKEYRS